MKLLRILLFFISLCVGVYVFIGPLPQNVSAAQGAGNTYLVSLGTTSQQGNGASYFGTMSNDNRFVLFTSDAENLVPGNSFYRDVFIKDLSLNTINTITVGPNGENADNWSDAAILSRNGLFAAFESGATNLVPQDGNQYVGDIFVRDLTTNVTELASISSAGTSANQSSELLGISGDGRYVLFSSIANTLVANDTNNERDIFLRDRVTQSTIRVSVSTTGGQGNGTSSKGAMSTDGRFIVFQSSATNLVPNDTNVYDDVFLHDRVTSQTFRILFNNSQISRGAGSPTISGDGRYIAYITYEDLMPNDFNETGDLYVYDRLSEVTELISVGVKGIASNNVPRDAALSDNGRYITFTSAASDLINCDYNNYCGDSRTENCMDIFLRDRETQHTQILSVSNKGIQGNSDSFSFINNDSVPFIASDGHAVLFHSASSNLVENDFNGQIDVFAREWSTTQPSTCRAYLPLTRQESSQIPSCAARDSEPNNRFSEADLRPLFCVDTDLVGDVTQNSDTTDIFRFEVTQRSNVHITLEDIPNNGDYDLYLDGGPGNNLDYSTNAGSQDESIRFLLEPGRYYIRVTSVADGNPNRYTLHWTN